jgi:5-methylcytosine-specific restriction endonuclease McrA
MKEKKRKKLEKPGNCKFCGFVSASKSGLAQHQKVCLNNPNANTLVNIQRGQKSTTIKVPLSILDVSKRTVAKILRRLKAGCSNCGWDEASCDIHHILPRSKGGKDADDNLAVLCPNCHRLAHCDKLVKFKSVKEQFGEIWREHYYSHK